LQLIKQVAGREGEEYLGVNFAFPNVRNRKGLRFRNPLSCLATLDPFPGSCEHALNVRIVELDLKPGLPERGPDRRIDPLQQSRTFPALGHSRKLLPCGLEASLFGAQVEPVLLRYAFKTFLAIQHRHFGQERIGFLLSKESFQSKMTVNFVGEDLFSTFKGGEVVRNQPNGAGPWIIDALDLFSSGTLHNPRRQFFMRLHHPHSAGRRVRPFGNQGGEV